MLKDLHKTQTFQTILKIALVITRLLKERNVSGRKRRKHESLVRTKKGTKGAFIREISKSTTHNFLRTTSPLQKMSSAPDKHSVKTFPSMRWGTGENSCGIERTSAARYTPPRQHPYYPRTRIRDNGEDATTFPQPLTVSKPEILGVPTILRRMQTLIKNISL